MARRRKPSRQLAAPPFAEWSPDRAVPAPFVGTSSAWPQTFPGHAGIPIQVHADGRVTAAWGEVPASPELLAPEVWEAVQRAKKGDPWDDIAKRVQETRANLMPSSGEPETCHARLTTLANDAFYTGAYRAAAGADPAPGARGADDELPDFLSTCVRRPNDIARPGGYSRSALLELDGPALDARTAARDARRAAFEQAKTQIQSRRFATTTSPVRDAQVCRVLIRDALAMAQAEGELAAEVKGPDANFDAGMMPEDVLQTFAPAGALSWCLYERPKRGQTPAPEPEDDTGFRELDFDRPTPEQIRQRLIAAGEDPDDFLPAPSTGPRFLPQGSGGSSRSRSGGTSTESLPEQWRSTNISAVDIPEAERIYADLVRRGQGVTESLRRSMAARRAREARLGRQAVAAEDTTRQAEQRRSAAEYAEDITEAERRRSWADADDDEQMRGARGKRSRSCPSCPLPRRRRRR